MASRAAGASRFGRRIAWLAVAVALVAAAYTAGWFYLARALEQRTVEAVAAINGPGVRASCGEPQARGFPFRIGVFCHSVFYENAREGVSVRAGALRSTANVYQPFRVLGEVDGPASIVLPYGAFEARWESLRASARLTRSLPERASLEGKSLVISAEEGDGSPLATVKDAQMHMRQQGLDVEAAASFRELLLGEEIVPGLPSIEGRILAVLKDGIALSQESVFDLRGRTATIEELVVGVAGSEAGLSLSGPVSVSDDGLLDADLSVKIEDFPAVARLLAQVFPEVRDHIMAASGVFGSLGDAPLQVRIKRGRAFLGFIPLGTIPPL